MTRICCTVICNGRNVAAELVKQGYAEVIPYRKDNPDRSIAYDELIKAECEFKARNQRTALKLLPAINVVRLVGEAAKSRSRTYIQQGTFVPAICEWIVGPGRVVLLVESIAVLTMNLAGIQCQRTDDVNEEKAAIAKEAQQLMRLNFLQRDVYVQILSLNKPGTVFQGVLMVRKKTDVDASELLLSRGYASLNKAGMSYYAKENSLMDRLMRKYEPIELCARQERRGFWATDAFAQEQSAQNAMEAEQTSQRNEGEDDLDRNEAVNAEKMSAANGMVRPLATYNAYLSWADKQLNIYVQEVGSVDSSRGALADLTRTLNVGRREGEVKDKHEIGEIVAVRSEDKQWLRARIDSKLDDDRYDLFFIDTGASVAGIRSDKIRALPAGCGAGQIPPLAKCVRLACCARVNDEDLTEEVQWRLAELSKDNKELMVSVYDRQNDVEQVVLSVDGEDVNKQCLVEGLVALRKSTALPKRLRHGKLYDEYCEAENAARTELKGIWKYCTYAEDADEDS